MLKTLRFETLSELHIPQILPIEAVANSAPWSEQAFRNELGERSGTFLVAIVDGSVVGYGGIWMVIDEAHVTTVAVAESHQRQGIGRRLMIELLHRAKAAGMTCSTLEVRAGNEGAIRLYEQLGYVIAARRKGYYPDNREDAIVMWLYELDRWEPPSA